MSNLNPGLISAYNSLSDKHLAGYFSNTRIRRHLQRAGLITRSGRIVPDKEYRHRLIQRAQQRHVRECLAQAIFHKVLEMERLHQIEIRRKLEEFARRERVYRIKVERSKRCEEDIVHILSPRPPTGTRGIQKQHSGPEGEHSESSESPGSSRPNTAPGKMQRPVRLKPIHSNSAMASLRRSSPYRRLESAKENDQLFPCTMDKDSRRRLTTLEASHGVSPYCLPVINNFVTPVPPATKRKERAGKVTASGTIRGRRLRPTTASSGADASEDPPMLRSSVHQSRVCVNMVYFGKSVHLSHDLTEMRDEVKVFQQHCGGENLCVYKGRLREGDTFQFISRRHRGFPFSLTFFLNGLQVERLSSCCEFKHRKGSRLGGRHGHFGFSSVEGASPCYRCIIAMGLDKKPIPPPNRVKEDERVGHKREELVTSPKDTSAYSDCETSQQQDMETQIKEETAAEDKVRNDYEEDFEADDEGPTEDCEAKEKTPASPSSEAERQVRETDASDTEDNEKGEKMQSRSGSSSLGSTQEESDGDAEVPKDSRDEETAEQPEKVAQEETVAGPDENDKPNPEEASKESDLQDSAGDSTEIDISDTSFPSGSENRQMEDTLGGREAEKMVDKDKQEEEQERAKSVQEKLAEAIFKESQCSSEPELSDTSTEEDEEATDKSHKQDNNDAVSEQEQALEEETKSEECVTSEDEGVQEQEETSGPNEKSESEKETTGTDADNEDSASQVETAENDQSVVTGAGGAEEKMPDDNTISETQEDDEFKSPDADAAQEADENEEKPAEAEEADVQLDQMGQGAKSSEEDESSLSDMNKETDETAVVDNAEAEAAMTMEMKAEPSEEQEALSCEEALVTDTDEGQQEDSKDTAAASENSSSSSQESADTMVEKTADISEDNGKDEGGTDDVKEEEATKDSAVEDDEKEMCEVGEELTGKSIEITDEEEKDTCEEESTDKLTQNNPGEIVEAENTEEKEIDEREKEENEESNTEERIEHEDITEGRRSDSDTEGQTNKETAEETLGEEDTAANDEKAAESEKDADDESARNKLDEEETEAQEAATDETNDGEGTNDSKTTADEERGDKAGKEEKDEIERKAEQFESVKNGDDESKENEIISDENGQEEDILGTTEEPDKGADEDICDNETAEGTKTTEEPLNNTMESEDAEKETEEADNNGENGGIDAENREVSTVTDNETHEDEAEAPNYNDLTTTEEPKIEEPTEDKSPGVNAATVESGDEAEEREDEEVDQVSETNVAQSEAKEEDVDVENQDNLEQETADTEGKQESNPDDLKGDREDGEEKKQNENDNVDQAQSSSAVDADLNETAQSTAMSEPQPDNQQHAGANFSAADEEHRGDEEEASKASKEGEGVLHKPPSQKEDDIVKGKVSPEVIAREDNTDLVTNWVTMHQTAKYFETFVEPLEDLREETSGKEAVQSTELLAPESPLKVGEMPENDEKDSGESEIKSNHAEDEAKETPQEETKVNDFRPNPETEENDKASTNGQEVKSEPKGSRGSTEEEQTNNGLTRTEEESMADTHQSAASVRAESVTEQTADNVPDLNEEQTEALKEDQGHSASPSGPKDTEETRGKTDEPSREVTEITDFITSKSDDGSQVESLQGEIQPKPSDGSIGGDGGDVQLIKDRLSSLSMDETLFGRSSYTMLSSALTESGH